MLFIPGNGRGVFTRLEIVTPEVGRQVKVGRQAEVESGTSGRGRKWDVRPKVGRQAESGASGRCRKWDIRPKVRHHAESNVRPKVERR